MPLCKQTHVFPHLLSASGPQAHAFPGFLVLRMGRLSASFLYFPLLQSRQDELLELENRILGSEERMSAFSAIGLLFILPEEDVALAKYLQWGLALRFQQETGRQQKYGKQADNNTMENEGTAGTRGHAPALPRELLSPLGNCGPEKWGLKGTVLSDLSVTTKNLGCFVELPNFQNNLKNHCLKLVQAT